MKLLRAVAVAMLMIVAAASLVPQLITGASYARQFRELPDSPPSRQHWLGTDDLGRDRLSRLLYGTRVSLLLAPAAALLATLLAALIGGIAGFEGGRTEKAVMGATDLFLSLPWLFLLITVRAAMPLNVSPGTSVIITFALLGCLGWAGAARVICSATRSIAGADFILLARASGDGGFRLLWRHVLPNLRPIVLAQFWLSVPAFILTEANLGVLGLGVSEPLPSWGSLLKDLGTFNGISAPVWQFAPLLLFVLVVSSFHLVLTSEELPA